MKVSVDKTKCCGHARCVAELPEVFGWDDQEDRAVVRDEANLAGLDESLLRVALNCPERAIVVDDAVTKPSSEDVSR